MQRRVVEQERSSEKSTIGKKRVMKKVVDTAERKMETKKKMVTFIVINAT